MELKETAIELAHIFVEQAHKGQERKFTGWSYITHLKETAQNLWDATEGQAKTEDYIAALCHDVIEDTDITAEEIGNNFGKVVMGLVMELTNNEEAIKVEGKKKYMVRKLNDVSSRALTIKLSDRLSNVSGLVNKKIPMDFVKWYVKETAYMMEHLDRETNAAQRYLIDKIKRVLLLVRLSRNF